MAGTAIQSGKYSLERAGHEVSLKMDHDHYTSIRIKKMGAIFVNAWMD
jgi:hypothetical protein